LLFIRISEGMRGLYVFLCFISSVLCEKIEHSDLKSKSSYANFSLGSSASSSALANKSSLPLHPALHDYTECQYVGEWGDCDPFKMVRIKEERLIIGGSSCVEKRNITKPCSRDDLPPGTNWLVKEHKLCVMELQKLKSMIEDLHRYIDLIHQRGQALYNAYNELRKRLIDLRREMSIISRKNHDAEQTIARLRKEVEDWKSKSNRMQMELNQLKAQYKGLEIKVRSLRSKSEELEKKKNDVSEEQHRNHAFYDALKTENRNLKTNVLDAERYSEQLRDAVELISSSGEKLKKSKTQIDSSKHDLNKCRLELAMPENRKEKPKVNKDTKVNLDMSMWITHNVTMEEGEAYEPVLKYYEEPSYSKYKK